MTRVVVHPTVRLLLPALVIATLFVTTSIDIMLAMYALGLLPLFLIERKIGAHIRFLVYGVVPIILTAFVIYGVVLKVDGAAWNELALRGMRFLILTTALQWSLTIPGNQLMFTFKMWGLRGSTLIVVLGAYILWADLQKAANRIVTARLASGAIGGRSKLIMVQQLPIVLLPMVISLLRTATVRSISWRDKDIVALVSGFESDIRSSIWYSAGVLFLGCVVVAAALLLNR